MSQDCSDTHPVCGKIKLHERERFCQTSFKKYCPCLCNKQEQTTSSVADGKCNIVPFNCHKAITFMLFY